MKSHYYVGTYTQDILFGTGEILEGKGKGIYLLELDHDTCLLSYKTLFSTDELSITNPSYLCLSHTKNTLYCVNEIKAFNETNGGAVTSIALTKTKMVFLSSLAPIPYRPTEQIPAMYPLTIQLPSFLLLIILGEVFPSIH